MASKKVSLFLLSAISVLAVGCQVHLPETEDIIGSPLEDMSTIAAPDSKSSGTVAIYDKTVQHIHQFDLQKMSLLKSYAVSNPEQDHYVFGDFEGNYFVDLTKKGFAIVRKDGTVLNNPVQLQGKPKSAAYNARLGYLVIYDDLQTVALLKLTKQGYIEKSWVSGVRVDGVSIVGGDLNENGELIVFRDDDSILRVDVAKTLENEKWTYTALTFDPLVIKTMSWLGPVPGSPDQILVKAEKTIALLDLKAQTIIDRLDIKYSTTKNFKNRDPHIIFNENGTYTLAFVQNDKIVKEKVRSLSPYLRTSLLDLKNDRWSYVDLLSETRFVTEDTAQLEFRNLRLNDMLTLETRTLPYKTKVQLADSFIFALFPSDLGKAVRYDLQSENSVEITGFNVKFVKP